jgi:hypothetical protein
MNLRRRGATGLLTAVLLAPGLAACGTVTTTDSGPDSGAPADPKQALLAATEAIGEGNFTFTMTGGELTADGSMHAPSRSARITMTSAGDPAAEISVAIDVIYVEPETWVRTDLSGLDELRAGLAELGGAPTPNPNTGKYQHLDRSRLKGIEDLEIDFQDIDPAGSAILAEAVTGVQKVDGGFAGTIDLTRATEAGLTDEEVVKTLGTGATVPFTAQVDQENRLTELALQIPAAGGSEARELKVSYEYDAAAPAKAPPASEVVEATDDMYEMFR